MIQLHDIQPSYCATKLHCEHERNKKGTSVILDFSGLLDILLHFFVAPASESFRTMLAYGTGEKTETHWGDGEDSDAEAHDQTSLVIMLAKIRPRGTNGSDPSK